MFKSLLKSGTALGAKFTKADNGNVAMMFSFVVFSSLVGIGAAIDFASAASKRADLQGYADAAVMAAAKSRSEDLAELTAIAQAVFDQHNTGGWPIEIDVRLVDDEVVVNAKGIYDAKLMGLVGRPEMEVGVETASPRAFLRPINLAMVLDTTASMGGANIVALRSAATGLIDTLSEFENNTNVSIVPFGQYVKIESQRGQAWLDIDNDGRSEDYLHTYTPRETITPSSCTPTGATRTENIVVDGRVTGTREVAEQDCTPAVTRDLPEVTETRTRSWTWHGCAGSRNAPYNLEADYDSTRIPGAMNVTCGDEMMPLMDVNDNKAAMRAKINSLTAVGETYLPSGLMWGWRSLSKEAPFERTVGLGKGYVDAILLMTDGANTRSQSGATHNGYNGDGGLEHFSAMCTAAKRAGKQIFTVGYRLGDNDTQQALLDCATNSGSNFSPETAAELASDFKEIAELLDTVRLSY